LDLVSTSLLNRVLSYRVCSPEHCWSELHLQRLSLDGDQLLCSKSITGLPAGSVLDKVTWDESVEPPIGRLEFTNMYDTSQSYDYQIFLDDPLGSCTFTLRKIED
jgi:hypothetical protein